MDLQQIAGEQISRIDEETNSLLLKQTESSEAHEQPSNEESFKEQSSQEESYLESDVSEKTDEPKGGV